jgi:hypothetical protein
MTTPELKQRTLWIRLCLLSFITENNCTHLHHLANLSDDKVSTYGLKLFPFFSIEMNLTVNLYFLCSPFLPPSFSFPISLSFFFYFISFSFSFSILFSYTSIFSISPYFTSTTFSLYTSSVFSFIIILLLRLLFLSSSFLTHVQSPIGLQMDGRSQFREL